MVDILGPDGRPVRREDLRESQTARYGMLHHTYAQHPSRGLTPSKLAAILEQAEQNDIVSQFELFEDMEEKDAHIASEMAKRRRALLTLEWDVVPRLNPSARERKAAEKVKEALQQMEGFEDVLFDTTDAIGKGFVCQEIEWTLDEGLWLPRCIDHRPQTWFRLTRVSNRQEIRLRDYSPDGEPLNPFGWIAHVHRAKSGYIERAALFRVLVWPYLFKNYSVGDLAEFLEIYGIPFRIGKYPPGASEQEKATLLRALVNIGHNAAGIIPEGMMIDLQKAAEGDPKAFELMIDWCERSQSKAILGQTLTSQADRGSNTNALGNIHNEVRKDLRDGDAKQVAATLTRDLVYPIAALNGWVDGTVRRSPQLKFAIEEPEDIKLYADALPKLVGMGMKIDRRWAQNKLVIPEPETDEDGEEDLLVAPKPVAMPGQAQPQDGEEPEDGDEPPQPPPRRGRAARAAAKAEPPSDPDAIEDYADAVVAALADRAAPTLIGWVDQVREAVKSADSYDALLSRLESMLGDLPIDDLGAVLQGASAASGLGGRSAVADESADGA